MKILEINTTAPKELEELVKVKVKECMEKAASLFVTKIDIPADVSAGDYWIH